MTRGFCATCFWWDNSASSIHSDNGETGLCRGGTPKLEDRSGLAVWPFSLEDDWCRHYEPDPLKQDEDIEPDEDATS